MSDTEETRARAKAHEVLGFNPDQVDRGLSGSSTRALAARLASLILEHERVLAEKTADVESWLQSFDNLKAECDKARRWVADLQSGMYVNCVYCGHRYGPDPGTPVAMADVLKAHVEACPEHPMAELKAERDALASQLSEARAELETARKVAAEADRAFVEARRETGKIGRELSEARVRVERLEGALGKVAAVHARYCSADERSPEEDAALDDFDDVCCNEVSASLEGTGRAT